MILDFVTEGDISKIEKIRRCELDLFFQLYYLKQLNTLNESIASLNVLRGTTKNG